MGLDQSIYQYSGGRMGKPAEAEDASSAFGAGVAAAAVRQQKADKATQPTPDRPHNYVDGEPAN